MLFFDWITTPKVKFIFTSNAKETFAILIWTGYLLVRQFIMGGCFEFQPSLNC